MSTADPTAAEILTALNVAILALVTKKYSSMTIDGRTYTYIDIDKLRAWRKELRAETRTTSNTVRVADVSGT